jgi:hypothetical protein
MQETWRIGSGAGEQLSSLPLKIFDGSELP